MTEIRFYHLTRLSLDQALPDLLAKCLEREWNAIVQVLERRMIEPLTKQLWLGRADSFLPHGSEKDGAASCQPIWITAQEENPNNAQVLFLTQGAVRDTFDDFDLVCDVFDGSDQDQLDAARMRWQQYKESAHNLTYWQQTEKGWEKQA